MYFKIIISTAALLAAAACQASSAAGPEKANQSEVEIISCIRTVAALDEGRWNYMGTIAKVWGKFRTYEAISVHAAAGPDMWSYKSFGGDTEVEEADAEVSYSKLVRTSMIPMEDGELKPEEAFKYLSCVGPDPEGRYEAHIEYKMPIGDGKYVTSKNMTWYSEHGSYYAEDIYNVEGRLASRRSGVNTPASE